MDILEIETSLGPCLSHMTSSRKREDSVKAMTFLQFKCHQSLCGFPVTVLLISLLVSSSTSYRLLSSISFPSLLVHTVTDDGFSSRLASFLLFFQEKNLLPAPPIQVHE